MYVPSTLNLGMCQFQPLVAFPLCYLTVFVLFCYVPSFTWSLRFDRSKRAQFAVTLRNQALTILCQIWQSDHLSLVQGLTYSRTCLSHYYSWGEWLLNSLFIPVLLIFILGQMFGSLNGTGWIHVLIQFFPHHFMFWLVSRLFSIKVISFRLIWSNSGFWECFI